MCSHAFAICSLDDFYDPTIPHISALQPIPQYLLLKTIPLPPRSTLFPHATLFRSFPDKFQGAPPSGRLTPVPTEPSCQGMWGVCPSFPSARPIPLPPGIRGDQCYDRGMSEWRKERKEEGDFRGAWAGEKVPLSWQV